MSTFSFTQENQNKCAEIMKRYDDKASALLPLLHLAQEQHGHLSSEVVIYIAGIVELPEVKIKEVISFYDMFYDRPTAKKIVQVCTNITCSLFGAREIYGELLHHYQAQNMKATSDGEFFFQKMECLGACEQAPCMRIDEDYIAHIDKEKAISELEARRNS